MKTKQDDQRVIKDKKVRDEGWRSLDHYNLALCRGALASIIAELSTESPSISSDDLSEYRTILHETADEVRHTEGQRYDD